MIFCFYRLLRVFYAAEFADDVNFNLPRIFEFGFDFLSDVLRKKQRLRVVDLIGLDDNADFAPRLYRVALINARKRACDRFEPFEPFDFWRPVLRRKSRLPPESARLRWFWVPRRRGAP